MDDPKCPLYDLASVVHRWEINPQGSIPQSSFHGFMVSSRAFKSISIMSSWYFKVQRGLQTSLWRLSNEFYLQSEQIFTEVRLRLGGYSWLKRHFTISRLYEGECIKILTTNIYQAERWQATSVCEFCIDGSLHSAPSPLLPIDRTVGCLRSLFCLVWLCSAGTLPSHIGHKHLSLLIPQTN